ncbi:unnamed protein product [Musa acuminata subsp. burmannicoides]
MPSGDHPFMLKVEEELQKVKSSVVQSSSTAHMICEGSRGIQGLYRCIEELLCLPSSNQIFMNPQQNKWVEVELEMSVRLLDLLGKLRDNMILIKEQIRDLEMTLRRQGEVVAQSKMQAYLHPNKKAEKDVKNCFRFLKQMDDKYALCCTDDKESNSWTVVRTLKAAREITISLLQSILKFLSMPRPKTKTSRWSLISKALHKRKVACEGEHEDIEANDDGRVQKARDQLQILQNSIDEIEAGLECLFRSLVQNRVSLLNILSLFDLKSRHMTPMYFSFSMSRSTSMPLRDHPLMLRVEEELQPVKSSVVKSYSTTYMIWKGLRGLQGLYRCIKELLCLPSSNQIFLNPKQKKMVEVELDVSIRLLDLLSTIRDSMISKKDQIKGLKMIFRRQGETVAQSKMQAYVHPDKAQKDVKNCFRFLKQMDDKYALCCIDDKESDSWMVITTLKEARDLTISLL